MQLFPEKSLSNFSEKTASSTEQIMKSKNEKHIKARIKKALIECANSYTACKYANLQQALRYCRAVITNEQELKNVFAQHQDKISIDGLLDKLIIGEVDRATATLRIYFKGNNSDKESARHGITAYDFNPDPTKAKRKSFQSITPEKQRGGHTPLADLLERGLQSAKEGGGVQTRPQSAMRERAVVTPLKERNTIARPQSAARERVKPVVPDRSILNQPNTAEKDAYRTPPPNENAQQNRPMSAMKEPMKGIFPDDSVSQLGKESDDPTPQELYDLVYALQYAGIDYRSLYNLFKDFLKLDDQIFTNTLSKEYFERKSLYWLKTLSPTLYQKVLSLIIRNGVVKDKVFLQILDAYKYMPVVIHKDKNDSEQFRKQVMIRDVPERETQLQRNFLLLGDRVEDRFKQITKAYRFFDSNKDGTVYFSEFKQGLDYIGIRFSDEETRELFNFIDKNRDGKIDHDEFCDLLEEKRQYRKRNNNEEGGAGHGHGMGHTHGINTRTTFSGSNGNPHIKIIQSHLDHKPKFGDFIGEDNVNHEEMISSKQSRFRNRNLIMRKAPVGAPKKKGYNVPSDWDPQFAYGTKSKPSEHIGDIVENNFLKEWLEKAKKKEQKREEEEFLRQNKEVRHDTEANILRQEYIKRHFTKPIKGTTVSRSRPGTRGSSQGNRVNVSNLMNNSYHEPRAETPLAVTSKKKQDLNTTIA